MRQTAFIVSIFLMVLPGMGQKQVRELYKYQQDFIISQYESIDFSISEILDNNSYLKEISKIALEQADTVNLLNSFYYFINSHQYYHQIRIIDQQGNERLKAIGKDGETFVSRGDSLQNKSGRYYFQKGIQLKINEIYLTKIDLNREFGVVEIPYVLVFRIVNKLILDDGREFLLVVNVSADRMFKSLHKYTEHGQVDFYIIDNAGFYLLSDDEGINYGGDIPERSAYCFTKQHPEVWNSMLSSTNGQVNGTSGVFTFYQYRLRENKLWSKTEVDILDQDFRFFIVLRTPKELINQTKKEIWRNRKITYSIVLVLVIVLGFLIRNISRRRQEQTTKQKEAFNLLRQVFNSFEFPLIVWSPQTKQVILFNQQSDRLNLINSKGLLNTEENLARGIQETGMSANENSISVNSSCIIEGKERQIWSITAIPFSADQKNAYVIVYLSNLTRELEAEREFRELLESAPEAMIISDETGEIRYINKTAEKLTGYKRTELLKQRIEFLLPERYNSHGSLRKNYLKDPQQRMMGTNRRLALKCKDEKEIPVEISLAPIHTKSGLLISAGIRDISERLKTESLLITKEEQLKLFVKYTPAAVAMLNTNMEYMVASDQWCTDYKIDSDIIGKSHYDVFPEIRKMPDWLEIHQRCLQGATEKRDEDPFVRQDGRIDYIRWEIHPWKQATGEIGGIIMFSQNVTREVESKKLIKSERDKLQSYLDNSPNLIIVLNTEGRIELINKAGARILEGTVADISGKNWFDHYIPSINKDEHKAYFKKFINSDQINKRQFQSKIVTETGEERMISWNNSLILDDNDNLVAVLRTGMDITERLKIEVEIKKNQQLLQEAQKVANLGSWEWDIDEDKVIWSDQVYKIFGVDKETFVPKLEEYLELIHPEDRSPLQISIADAISKAEGYSIQHRIITPDGTEKIVESVGEVEAQNGIPIRLFGVVMDKTQSIKAQNEIIKLNESLEERVNKRTQELEAARLDAEKANKAKSEFLANMSHEIRTPMNAILGFTRLLEKRITEPKQREFVKSINASGKSLLTLINDILDLSKVESGKLDIVKHEVEFVQMLDEIKAVFAQKAKDKDLEYEIKHDGSIPEYLIIDEVRLRQVLINLIGNAMKFTIHGKVSVQTDLIHIRTTDESNFVDILISVSDTGVGIPAKDLARIFDSFTQKEGQDSRVFEGTGLGLTISRKLLELMGGQIDVESQEGVGSTFTIRLNDIEVGEHSTSNITVNHTYYFHSSKILIVDDKELNRNLVKELFEESDVELKEAENGKEAISVFKSFSPDIVLMDLRMPVMDGKEASIYLKKISPDIPIIALTASAIKGRENELIDKDLFDSIIYKPFNFNDFYEVLANYIPFEKTAVEASQKEDSYVEQLKGVSNETAGIIYKELNALEQEWENAVSSNLIDNIIEVASGISQIGQDQNVDVLVHFGDKVSEQAERFDIQGLMKLTPEFGKILEYLKTTWYGKEE